MSTRLFIDRVPVYDGFNDVVERIVSTLHRDNAKAACRVIGAAPPWSFDPLTSGGLIAGVKPDAVVATLASLHQAGYDRAVVIGEIVGTGQDPGPSIHLA